jgi:hypothetical protein
MVNHSLPHLPFSSKKTREESKTGDQRTLVSFKRIFIKWFGFAVTLLLLAAALAPDALNVPLHWRAWIFVTSIFWFLCFCAGIFNE